MASTSTQLGRRGEDAAAQYLTTRGWRIIERNWHACAGELRGELDVIAERGDVLAIVEVKTRHRGPTPPSTAVSARKLRQLRRLAGLWLSTEADRRWRQVRVDVIEVDAGRDGTLRLSHLEGVA